MRQVMIVTGGSQGIGEAVARLAAARGYAVALTYQSNKALADAVVADIEAAGGRAIAVRAEMADEASILALYRAADEKLGPVTALVNNAGTPGTMGKIDTVTAETLDTGPGGQRPSPISDDPRSRRPHGDGSRRPWRCNRQYFVARG